MLEDQVSAIHLRHDGSILCETNLFAAVVISQLRKAQPYTWEYTRQLHNPIHLKGAIVMISTAGMDTFSADVAFCRQEVLS